MTTGTITLTNKSTAVTGSGTAFTTELAVGGFIVATVGGTPYTLGIQAIGSDTSLTLTQAYDGPTTSGVAFDYVPLATLNLITSALASQVSYAIRGLNLDKNNWQLVFSESGDITITIPDGTTFTGPSWKKISDLLAGIDPDALQQIADQIAADAQQVSADRADVDTKAAQVATNTTTATQAASDAVAANTTAQQAKTDAQSAQTLAEAAAEAAEESAASIDTSNLLNKNNNLSELTDVPAARIKLDVYSKAETDTKVSAVGSRIGYALISAGTIGINARTVFTNPFGASVPVIAVAEVYVGSLWSTTGWIFNGSNGNAYGAAASYVEGVGVVLQTGLQFLYAASNLTGGGGGITTTGTSATCRIHVWKVTA